MSEHPTAEDQTAEPTPPVESPGIPWGLAFALVVAVLLVVFAVQNTQDVQLRFLAWEITAPLAIVVAVAVVAAIVFDELLGWALRQRRRRRLAEKEELRRLRERHREQ